MSFDIRTTGVMTSMLCLILSGLLTLASLHAGSIRGVRQWALGSLCFSIAFSLSYVNATFNINNPSIVLAATMMAAGLGFQLNGIQLFKKGRDDKRILWLLVVSMLAVNVWLVILHPDTHARVVSNSLIMALGSTICSRELLIRIEQPLQTAYWFTGSSFAIFALALLARSMVVFSAPPNTYTFYSQTPINSMVFFFLGAIALCQNFGFVLMLNYRLASDLQKLASRDALTGALNRRSLEEEATRLWARSQRTGDTLALMMLDADHFKAINDRYGHQTGDEVLRQLAAVAQGAIRSDDYFARYGGEEFCILLPSTNEAEALLLAERIRQRYAGLEMKLVGETLRNTVSIGVSDSHGAGLEFTSLLAAADQAMYQAKQRGRNCTVQYSALTGHGTSPPRDHTSTRVINSTPRPLGEGLG